VKPKKSGFVLLETVVCLAVLGILFPLTQKCVLFLSQKFQYTRLRLQAVQIARTELSRMESQLELRNTDEKYEGVFTRSEKGFLIESEIKMLEITLRKMTVQVQWQFRENPETYMLSELYIPLQKNEKNATPS